MVRSYLKYFSFVDLTVYIIIFFFVNLLGAIISNFIIQNYGAVYGVENISKFAYIPIFLFIVILSSIYRRVRCVLTMSPCRFVSGGRLSANSVLFGMAMMVAVSIVTDPLISLFPVEMAKYVERFSTGNMWVTLGVTVIVAPILEEIFFRGILLKDMSISWGPRWAIFISSLLFSALHFNIIQAVPAFLMGLVIGYIYIYTRRGLTTVILIHIINNLISSVSLFWGFGIESVWQKYLPQGWIFTLVYVIAALCVVLLIVRIATLGNRSSIIKKLHFNDKK